MQPSIENICKERIINLVDFKSIQAKTELAQIDTQFFKIEISSNDFG